MATTVETLIDLQEVDGRIRELEAEEKDLPRKKAMEKARLSGAASDLESAKAALDYARGKADEFEKESLELQEKIRQLKTVQAGLKTNREYQQYAMQIENVERDREAADNSQVAALDQIPSAEKRLAEAQARYDEENGAIEAFCAEIDERMAAVSAELAEQRAERVVRAAAVDDPQFKQYYERIKLKRWPAVVQLTHDGVCDGCHLVQPPSVGQLVNANSRNGQEGKRQRVVACTMCGRILYGEA